MGKKNGKIIGPQELIGQDLPGRLRTLRPNSRVNFLSNRKTKAISYGGCWVREFYNYFPYATNQKWRIICFRDFIRKKKRKVYSRPLEV